MHHIFLWALSKMSPCAWSSHPMGFLMLSCCCCHQLWTAAALLRLCFLGTSVATLIEEVTETLPLTLLNILSSEPRERPGSEWDGFEGWSCILVTAIVLPDICWAYNGCSFMGTVPSTREKTQSRGVQWVAVQHHGGRFQGHSPEFPPPPRKVSAQPAFKLEIWLQFMILTAHWMHKRPPLAPMLFTWCSLVFPRNVALLLFSLQTWFPGLVPIYSSDVWEYANLQVNSYNLNCWHWCSSIWLRHSRRNQFLVGEMTQGES